MELAGKKILVTGVTGTLGDSAARKFIKEGVHVRGLIRDKQYIGKLQELGINPIIGDLTNLDSLLDASKNVDIIIHCAAYLGEDLEAALQSNVTGVENIAKAALANGVQKFIHISSLSVYGEPNEGYFDESFPITPNHVEVYVATKSQSEQILNVYKEKGLDVIILRPGAICAEENSWWGDRQIDRMLKTDSVDWVHPEDMVPWVHTDNLVEMIHLVLSKDVSNEVYNTIDGNFPEKEFRVKLISALGKKMEIPNRIKQVPIYDYSKIKELGYRPLKSFEQTITNLVKSGLNR